MAAQAIGPIEEFQRAPWRDAGELQAFVEKLGVPSVELVAAMVEQLHRPPKGLSPPQVKAMHQAFLQAAPRQQDPRMMLQLAEALALPNDQLRRSLARVLVRARNKETLAKLLSYLKHRDNRLRDYAARVLADAGSLQTFNVLQNAIAGDDWVSRVEALDVLARLGKHRALRVFRKALSFATPEEVDRIVLHLGDERVYEEHAAVAVEVLLLIVRGSSPAQRKAAMAMLGRVAGPDTASAVAELVWDEDPALAQEAIQVLGRLGGKAAISTLARVAAIGHPSARVAAAKGLAETSSGEAIFPLIKLLEHEDVLVRDASIQGLTRLGRAEGVDVTQLLVEMTSSEDVNVRRAVIEIVDSVGDPDGTFWKRLVRRLRDSDWWVRERATEVLLKIARHQVLDEVMDLLADDSDVVRRYGIDVLVKFREQRGLVPLARMARDDPDWLVREKAVEALGEIGDERVVPMLIELSEEGDLAWACVGALGRLGDPRAGERLRALFSDGNVEMKLHVLRASDRVGGEGAKKLFEKAITDVDKEVREEAAGLLARRQIRINDAEVRRRMSRSVHFVDQLLEECRNQGGTDLYLVAGRPPCMKLYSDVVPLRDEPIGVEQAEELARVVLSEGKWQEFQLAHDVDSSYQSISEKFRFRVNVFRQRRGVSIVFRVIADEILEFDSLGLPGIVLELTSHRAGLMIVSGPTNSGKSTTLTTLLDHINRTYAKHIITVEDPIEYVHENKRCLVNQREIGTHATSFTRALRSLLREDPDVILLGEMRDQETIRFAVTAAETGHLVLATLHTVSAPKTVERIIDAFPAHQQSQIRVMLSESLRGVICQQLLDKADGSGRILACEVMLNTQAVANLIRSGKSHHITQTLTTGYDQGMRLLDRELLRLVSEGVVTIEEAFIKANDGRSFMRMVEEAKMGALDVDEIEPGKRLEGATVLGEED